MANQQDIVANYPAIAEYGRNYGHRGEVLTYLPNVAQKSWSTDAQGFRHSVFDGKAMSVADCIAQDRYGIVMGASNIFGTGLSGNDKTIASLLAERFAMPFACAALPGANSRNLNAQLLGLMTAAKNPPAVVVLSNGGDLSTFCEAGYVDPVFGSPNHIQLKNQKNKPTVSDPDGQIQRLAAFSGLWASAIHGLCRLYGVPLVLIHQSTIFDKKSLSEVEKKSGLGEPATPGQKKQFDNFKRVNPRFFEARAAIAKRLGVPLAGVGLTEQLSFIDEYHLDDAGTAVLAKAVGDAIEPLLQAPAKKEKSAAAKAR